MDMKTLIANPGASAIAMDATPRSGEIIEAIFGRHSTQLIDDRLIYR